MEQKNLRTPGRLWNLWEMLNVFEADTLLKVYSEVDIALDLWLLAAQPQTAPSEDNDKVLNQQTDYALKLAAKYFAKWPMGQCAEDVETAKHELLKKRNHAAQSAILLRLKTDILNAVERHKFVSVGAGEEDLISNERLFGDSVYDAFPSAREEITEAGNCLGVGCDTAAVFHLMRVVEYGLRAFCAHLGVKEVVEKYDKSGTGLDEYKPVEYATWDKILGQLTPYITKKVAACRDHAQRQRDQEFYYAIREEIAAVKDAWRNHVMHSRSKYTHDDAKAVLSHVKRLMTVMATRIPEA